MNFVCMQFFSVVCYFLFLMSKQEVEETWLLEAGGLCLKE